MGIWALMACWTGNEDVPIPAKKPYDSKANTDESVIGKHVHVARGSKVPKYGVCTFSILGIRILFLGWHLAFGSLDP